jgi:precorrin-6B methylase 2
VELHRRAWIQAALGAPLAFAQAARPGTIDLHLPVRGEVPGSLSSTLARHGIARALLRPQDGPSTMACLAAAKRDPQRYLAACRASTAGELKTQHRAGARALILQPSHSAERLVYEAAKSEIAVLFEGNAKDPIRHIVTTFADADFVIAFPDADLAILPNVFVESARADLRNVPHEKLIFASRGIHYPASDEPVLRAFHRANAERLLRLTESAQMRKAEEQREERQKTAEIFRAMRAGPGMRVAEVGAGWGFFPVRLAAAVGPAGRVYAVDVSHDAVLKLKKRVEEDALANVEVIEGAAGDPKLPAGKLDAVLIADAYHEMTDAAGILRGIRAALRPGGRLVLVDMIGMDPERRKWDRKKQVDAHEMAPEVLSAELREAGFVVIEQRDPFIEDWDGKNRFLLVAQPK